VAIVVFRDLQKLVSYSQQIFLNMEYPQYDQEDIRTNGDCCFNHINGLTQKDGIGKPIYDYETYLTLPCRTAAGDASERYTARENFLTY
jgi:hypothetical protein